MELCHRDRSGRIVAALAWLVAALAAGPAVADDTRLTLHPVVGDVIDAEEAGRWGLFSDLRGVTSAVFSRTPAGNIVARIVINRPDGPVTRERSIPAAQWASWRADLDAGRRVAAWEPPEPGRVWPEVPLRPEDLAPPPVPVDPSDYPTSLAGDWVMQLDFGYKHSTTDFNRFFTDMAMFQLGVGYAVNDHWTPFLNFHTGFGDLVDAFEDVTGNGKSAIYAFELGARLSMPLGDRVAIAGALAGGYYMRSLRWGGDLFFSPYGTVQGGSNVRELSDWGGSVRLGFQRRMGDRPESPIFLDVSVRYEGYGADPSILADPVSGAEIRSIDHDRWLALSVGFIFEL